MTTFWFYQRVMDRRDSIVVHAGWCRSCNEGAGYSQRVHNRRTPDLSPCGRWHGPYAHSLAATAAAGRLVAGTSRRVKLCGLCLDTDPVDPIRRRTPMNRSRHVAFWLHVAHGGFATVHASTCPCFAKTGTLLNRDGPDRFVVGSGGDWYGPHGRLAGALSKAEELIEGSPLRMRHCVTCGWNGRLRRLDDLLATPFACDVAASVDDAATANQIVCLECGKGRRRFRTHLREAHQMTPERYREVWKLPVDFPMIPQGYQKRMSRIPGNVIAVAQNVPDKTPTEPAGSDSYEFDYTPRHRG